MILTPVVSLCCYETTILTLATDSNIWGYILLSVGNIKQANAEQVISSQQKTVFQTGQHKLGRKQLTNDSKQGKQNHTNLFNSETVFHNGVTIYQVWNRDLKYFPQQLH